MKGSKGSPSLMKRMVEGLSSKTNELRARIMIFFLLHKGLQPGSISHKLHALLGGRVRRHHKKHDQDLLDRQEQHELLQQPEDHEDEVKKESAVHPLVYCNNYGNINDNDLYADDPSSKAAAVSEIVEENGPYYYHNHHDLNKLQDGVEMVKEEELVADDNIDQAADLFIKRFRQQIWLQKQLSSCEFNRGADTTTMISTL